MHYENVMARRIRMLYEWQGPPDSRRLRRTGTISEAKLRAWEYHAATDDKWSFSSGGFHDTVRVWVTARPDLRIPERLLVGDFEERTFERKP